MLEPATSTIISGQENSCRSRYKILLVVALLLLHVVLAVSSVRHKSNTFDEYIHLTAGYSYWTLNDYRLQPENGNLPQRWAALPLIFSRLSFPQQNSPVWEDINVWEVGHRFFYKMGNPVEDMLFKGRVMVCLLSVCLALTVFLWSRQVFGTLGGFISLGLYAFSPTMIAHARLTTSDMASALFFILAIKLLWNLMHRITWQQVVMTGLSVGGLLLSKMSGVLIVPMAAILLAIRLLSNKPLSINIGKEKIIAGRLQVCAAITANLAIVALISTVVLWGFYGFRFTAMENPPAGQALSFPKWSAEIEKAENVGKAVAFIRDRQLLPEAYLFGFTYVITHAKIRPAFYKGAYSTTGWWQFFPFCYAVKTPLASILLLLIALLAIIRRKDGSLRYNLVPLVVLTCVYWLVAMNSNINIGHRHILVTYPAFFIISGAVSIWSVRFIRICRVLVPVMFLVYMAETLPIWPDYLAFFNVSGGGPQRGYQNLVDSSLDWGQDLPALSRWLQENNYDGDQAQVPVYLSYFGTASPKHYNLSTRMIVFRNFPWARDIVTRATSLEPGIYCISATSLQQVYGMFGGWRQDSEQLYWKLMDVKQEYETARKTPETWSALTKKYGSAAQISRLIQVFKEMQFARLCYYLKQREPDHQIGHSILVYFTGPRELWKAIEQPWPEVQ